MFLLLRACPMLLAIMYLFMQLSGIIGLIDLDDYTKLSFHVVQSLRPPYLHRRELRKLPQSNAARVSSLKRSCNYNILTGFPVQSWWHCPKLMACSCRGIKSSFICQCWGYIYCASKYSIIDDKNSAAYFSRRELYHSDSQSAPFISFTWQPEVWMSFNMAAYV